MRLDDITMAHPLERDVLAKLRLAPYSSADLQLLFRQSQAVISRVLSGLMDQEAVVALGHFLSRIFAATERISGLPVRVPTYRVDNGGNTEIYGQLIPLTSGRMAFVHPDGEFQLLGGLPLFLQDMRPQGFLGRLLPQSNPELFQTAPARFALSLRISEWTARGVVLALSTCGEDCVGDLILGEQSLQRFRHKVSHPALVDDPQTAYPLMAVATLDRGQAGSAAGGEQPKFLANVRQPDGRMTQVLVKFSGSTQSAVDERTRDLLLAESQAQIAISQSSYDIATSRSRVIHAGGRVFLEVERFDRIGDSGRRGTVTLGALATQFADNMGDWASMADDLLEEQIISAADADRIRFLHHLGVAIWNTDMHPGNLSFFRPPDLTARQFELAPVYDMLPMAYAPVSGEIVDPPGSVLEIRAKSDRHTQVERDAMRCARLYWQNVAALNGVTDRFKAIAERNL